MPEIHLDNLYTSTSPLLAKLEGEPATPNGLPVQGQVDRHEAQRGADTIVELSPQATEAAAEGSDPNESTHQENAQANEHEQPENAPHDDTSQSTSGKPLTDEQQKQVEDLKQRDQEVRRHEQAHKAAAGSLAQGGPTFTYQTGPDGTQYAVGGEVQIDSSPVEGDPAATIRKMEQVQRAAQAPAEPSSQDQAVAAQAAQAAQQARQELSKQKAQESDPEVQSSHTPGEQEQGSLIDSAAETTAPSNTTSLRPTQALGGKTSQADDRFNPTPSRSGSKLDLLA